MLIKKGKDLTREEIDKCYIHLLELIHIESPAATFITDEALELLYFLELVDFNNDNDMVEIKLTNLGRHRLEIGNMTGNTISKVY